MHPTDSAACINNQRTTSPLKIALDVNMQSYPLPAEHVSANTKPHQLCWGDQEMETAISYTECSQMAGLIQKVSIESSKASSLCAAALHASVFRSKIVAIHSDRNCSWLISTCWYEWFQTGICNAFHASCYVWIWILFVQLLPADSIHLHCSQRTK